MYLDYSKIEFDKNGVPEMPELVLKTLGGNTLGVIPGVFNLKMNIKFSEPSEISFDVPAKIDGVDNPFYDFVVGHKLIYTKHYGVYVIMNPKSEEDGILDVKHIQGYSYEKTLESKKFFLEEGTFNFWNPASPTDTVIGRILEIAVGWSVGYIAPTLIGRYRTFDKYDDYLLSFMYNSAPKKFRCIFVFDTYKKTINAYDADAELTNLPIYLDFDNLLESLEIEELDDELVTAIRPYGADGLDVRGVNPIGTNWIYDISYFIANGDIKEPLASKWRAWQRSILNNQLYYKGLVAMQASATARLLSERAVLSDLKGELENLTAQQSVTIQAIAMETTAAGKSNQQAVLEGINRQIASKKAEIGNQESAIASVNEQLDVNNPSSYTARIQAITKSLAITNYFTSSEYEELSNYFIEQDVTEDTFVATSVDTSINGSTYSISNGSISVAGSSISEVDLRADFGKRMYVMAGGTFSLSGTPALSGDIIRGTLEVSSNNSYVLSFYAGTIRTSNKTAPSGMITMSGTLSGLSSDISAVTVNGITTREGKTLRFTSRSGSLFLTANVSDYQKYSVQMELFEYAVNVLDDLAIPTYEFSVDSANFIFAKEFAPFRNKLELGKGVYLNIGDKRAITPYIIEFELDFEEHNQFSIVFSNRFKRHDYVNTLKDMLESSYSTSRSFDASKYIYNQAVGQTSMVSKFLSDSLEAAKNTIIGAANQTVVIDGAGIHVGGDSKYEIRIVDRMIAITDDNWASAKMAIGLFASEKVGKYFGVNAEVIGGRLVVGNNLIIENENDRGVMQFKVDSTGAWLYNASFVLQSDARSRASSGGLMILDPDFGIVAGTHLLFNTNGTTVTPEFLDKNGTITYDSEGMPQNANFFLDIRDGSAYFRGHLNAKSGTIGGWTLENQYLRGGSGHSFVALNGSSSNSQYLYAIWAGAVNPSSAPFWVKKDGTLHAKVGTFGGTLEAASGSFSGELKAATGTFKGSLQAASGTFTGQLQAATGTFSGSLQAATGTFSGQLQAATGTFSGVVRASDFQTPSGVSMLTGGKFKSDYLDLYGLTIRNKSTNAETFKIDTYGNVTVNGNITMGAGSKIQWNSVSQVGEDPQVTALRTSVGNQVTNLQTDMGNMQQNMNHQFYLINQEVDYRMTNMQSDVNSIAYNLNLVQNNMLSQREVQNIASTIITDKLIQAPTIQGAYIQGGTMQGVRFCLGRFGTIYDGYGHDGVSNTDLIQITSSRGIVISANNGLRLDAGGGIWLNGDVHIRVGGSWVNLADAINK